MPKSHHDDLSAGFDDEAAKQALFTKWLAVHPYPTWEHVRRLLMTVGGEDGWSAARKVDETYLKSELDIIGLLWENVYFHGVHRILPRA